MKKLQKGNGNFQQCIYWEHLNGISWDIFSLHSTYHI